MSGPGDVKTGLEVLLDTRGKILRGLRYGLICHPASVNRSLEHASELLLECGEGELAALFGPEHGATGEAQDMIAVDGIRDPRTGLPVYSLYGKDESSLAPAREALSSLDMLLFDLQDVGARYYTFAATMAAAMEACGRAGVPFVVLDRPNPIDGMSVEGNLVKPPFRSFVGRFPLPARHGMTIGELARLYNRSFGISCDLTVVPMEGWRRESWFDETGLPWVAPSPNIPTPDTASVYPGTCLVEGTNLSEGRGTTRPFEWIGAPYLDPHSFGARLAAKRLPGAVFRPMRFTPHFHKWSGTSCGGVQIHVTDRATFRPFLTGLAIIASALELAPDEFGWRREPYEFVGDRLAIDLLLGDDSVRQAIERGAPLAEIEQSWKDETAGFLPLREEARLY